MTALRPMMTRPLMRRWRLSGLILITLLTVSVESWAPTASEAAPAQSHVVVLELRNTRGGVGGAGLP